MHSRILEISNITDVVSSIEGPTLILIDVDDTLIRSSLCLGSKEWVAHLMEELQTISPELTAELDPIIWNILQKIPFSPVELSAPKLIWDLQSRVEITMFGFTSRPIILMQENNPDSNLTSHQLACSGIDFTKVRYSEAFYTHPQVQKGIIFSCGLAKGEFLKQLLEQINHHPSKVIFIDDRIEQIKSVDNAMNDASIPCDCYWYRHLEKQKTKIFDPLISAIQLHYLLTRKQIISDQEAGELRNTHEKLAQTRQLDQIIDFHMGT